jgi:hypothetical protein
MGRIDGSDFAPPPFLRAFDALVHGATLTLTDMHRDAVALLEGRDDPGDEAGS